MYLLKRSLFCRLLFSGSAEALKYVSLIYPQFMIREIGPPGECTAHGCLLMIRLPSFFNQLTDFL